MSPHSKPDSLHEVGPAVRLRATKTERGCKVPRRCMWDARPYSECYSAFCMAYGVRRKYFEPLLRTPIILIL